MNQTVKILDRIKKLLAMAQGKGGSANEVAVAAAEAARLMQLHKLTEADIPTDSVDGPDMVDLPAGADFLDSWKFVLVTCVARSFMCEAVGLRAAARRKVRVVGRREDVEVALEVYRHLAGEIDRLTAAYEGEAGDFDDAYDDIWGEIFGDYVYPAEMGSVDRSRARFEGQSFADRPAPRRRSVDPMRRESYRDGLVAGIATKLKEQKVHFEESGEKAMVLARKSREEIRNHIANKFADPKKVERPMPRSETMEEVDFARGFIRGQSVVVPGKGRKDETTKGAGGEKRMRQYDDYESSTRVCPCGSSITWSGFGDRLEEWMRDHTGHVDDRVVEQVTTADGERGRTSGGDG